MLWQLTLSDVSSPGFSVLFDVAVGSGVTSGVGVRVGVGKERSTKNESLL